CLVLISKSHPSHTVGFLSWLRRAAIHRFVPALRASMDPVPMTATFAVNNITPVATAAGTHVLHARLEPVKKSSILINLAHLHCSALRARHRDLRAGFQSFGLFPANDWKWEIVIV